MSSLAKSTISFRKVSTSSDLYPSLGAKKLVFAHKFSASGTTDVDLTNLTVPPEYTALGFVNASANDLSNASIFTLRSNLRLVSSIHGLLMDYLSYDVVSNTKFRLKNGAQSTINEIITGY